MLEREAKNFLIHSIKRNLLKQMRKADEQSVREYASAWWEDCKEFAVYQVDAWDWCFRNAERRKNGVLRCSDFLAELEVYQPPAKKTVGLKSPASKHFSETVLKIANCEFKRIPLPKLSSEFISEFKLNAHKMDIPVLKWWRARFAEL